MPTIAPGTIILPGDCLLYRPSSLMGLVIAVKTWTWVSHVEVYHGANRSLASRDGKGVGMYRLRLDDLGYVLRPNQRFSLRDAELWAADVIGQKYDWLGLLCFTLAVHQGDRNKMFCSEFATRLYRAGGLQPFSPETDADHVAPAQFLQTPVFDIVWHDKQ